MGRKNIKIEFRYDGSRYYGFQRQPDKITVQGEIEKILRIVTKEEINLISAGRTDRGVHAYHQVSNFYTSSNIPIEKYKYLLTRALPNDIVFLSVEEVDENFNARHNAKMREYIYIISLDISIISFSFISGNFSISNIFITTSYNIFYFSIILFKSIISDSLNNSYYFIFIIT